MFRLGLELELGFLTLASFRAAVRVGFDSWQSLKDAYSVPARLPSGDVEL